ncbi:FkbM family methyltransferase [Nocardioides sp. GXZ039]|uniref:FkbM family methyltransferase n=1 Tax=Nocardioides sp. GXZ039 TaxID=3136018 RepID=UPI0030F48E41
MVTKSSVLDRGRVLSRVAMGRALDLVPLSAIRGAQRRGVLRSVLRHRDLSGMGTVTVPGPHGIRLAAVDSRLVRLLYWYGEEAIEGHEVHWWRHFCTHATAILEVGANIGYYTVQGALAAPTVPYRAVEAHPTSAATVRRNLELNRITNVDLVEAAAVGSPDITSVELALPELERYATPTGAFVRDATEGVEARRPASGSITVPAVPATELADGVDLVKLDIEGSEHLVLEPILDPLVERRATILVEVLRETPKLRALLAGLAERSYRFWVVADVTLMEIDATALLRDDLLTVHGSRDIAVIPAEREDLLTLAPED